MILKKLRKLISNQIWIDLITEADEDISGISIPERKPDDDGTPATARQTFALFAITKKDFRKAGLTYKQASELIARLNAEKGYVPATIKEQPALRKYLLNKEIIGRLVKSLYQQMGVKSKITDDPMTVKSGEGQSYAFYGTGMGFAHLIYDKRSKLAGKIAGEANETKRAIDLLVINTAFSKTEQQTYRNQGWPLEAMVFQNMGYNSTYWWIIAEYMKSIGIKNVTVKTIVD